VVAEPIKTVVEQETVVAVVEEEAEIISLYEELFMQTGPMVPVVSNTTTGLL
jgi:hypothetical protein